MSQPTRIHIFQGYGIELEYMIVDKDTLAVKPITDELLKVELGEYGSDFENGIVTWSNELVLHVVELKSTRPESNFNALESFFFHKFFAQLHQSPHTLFSQSEIVAALFDQFFIFQIWNLSLQGKNNFNG